MSAFYDIWITNNTNHIPNHVRAGSVEWRRHNNISGLWCSESRNSGSFVTEATLGNYRMLMIGQLYENISNGFVLNNCIEYIEGRSKTYNDPAGHYVILIYNSLSSEYYVFTNRLGTYHVYWSAIDGINALSTYYIGLAKQATTKELDWEGISGFMAMGFFPGNTTYLQGITILEPASYYKFSSTLDIEEYRRYWNWNYDPVSIKNDELYNEFNSILSDIINTSLKGKRVALPISGGLDSRTLAGVLGKERKVPESVWSYSYGYNKKSAETKIAAKLARTLDLPFNAYIVEKYLFNKAETIIDAVELFQYIDGTRQASVLEQIESHANTVLCGHWGDVWMDDSKIPEGNIDAYFQKKIVKRGSDWLLREVCQPNFKAHDTVLKNYFSHEASKHKHIANDDFRMKIFKTDQWSFRWTIPSIRMYQAAAMPTLPFYDKRVVDFFLRVPTEVVKDRNFQVEYIKRYHPELARVKWQEYNVNLYNYKIYNNRNILYRGFQKIKSTVAGNKPIRRNWELFYLNEQGKANLKEILVNNPTLCDIVPKEKIKELLVDFYDNPSPANGYTISMLHTFAQFLNHVF
ncbi:MAG: hypothetical protein JST82_08845 [Bacteroidetes bacterium]|nr:hypothetical protein [Bacteroidota bacterium]